jgi:hypothetical protein
MSSRRKANSVSLSFTPIQEPSRIRRKFSENLNYGKVVLAVVVDENQRLPMDFTPVLANLVYREDESAESRFDEPQNQDQMRFLDGNFLGNEELILEENDEEMSVKSDSNLVDLRDLGDELKAEYESPFESHWISRYRRNSMDTIDEIQQQQALFDYDSRSIDLKEKERGNDDEVVFNSFEDALLNLSIS